MKLIDMQKDAALKGLQLPFGMLEVWYPDPSDWDTAGFEALKRRELDEIMLLAPEYDRKRDFSEDPYFRYFRKFKKTYPVMAQLESFLLKGRPFPEWSPINQVAFLTELKTRVLLGTHDVERVQGPVTLYRPAAEESFTGMGGRESHSYKGDLTGRDDGGIILSMIAGPDERTCLQEDTLHPVYLVFAPEGYPAARVESCLEQIAAYVRALAPGARMERLVL